MSWDLDAFSKGIKKQSDRREAERVKFNELLGEPQHFIPFKDGLVGHGFGFFKINADTIHCYRKYSNGYERYPTQIFDRQLIEVLAKLFEKG